MNSLVQRVSRMLTGLWYYHQRELDQRDERIDDLEMIVTNQKYEIDQLRSQLDQYRSIFSIYQPLNRCSHADLEHHRSGVSAPPSTLCILILWQKSTW